MGISAKIALSTLDIISLWLNTQGYQLVLA
jgi:hypothetical protein